MKNVAIALLALLSAVSAGCAAAREAQTAAANAPTANVAGTWSGSAGTGGVFMPVRMTLGQTGTAVSGTVDIGGDRKSTRLNSSHRCISYAVFCLKKKNHKKEE